MNRGTWALAVRVCAVFLAGSPLAHAQAALTGGPNVDRGKVDVSTAAVDYDGPDSHYCEHRWTEAATATGTPSVQVQSVRARYEVDRTERGFLYGYCPREPGSGDANASEPAPADLEQLVVLTGNRYTAIASPGEDTAPYIAPLDTYARAQSLEARAAALEAMKSLPNGLAPVLEDGSAPGRSTLWLPRLRCAAPKVVYVYKTRDKCAGPVSRTVRISESASSLSYGSGELAPPEDIAPKTLEESYASRTARLEWWTANQKLEHCSGLFVTANVVLTARHCVEDEKLTRIDCLNKPMHCQSYAVDVNVGAAGEVMSASVQEVIAGPPGTTLAGVGDYALVTVFKSHALDRLAKRWPRLALVQPTPERLQKGSPLMLLANPLGYRLVESSRCRAFYPSPIGSPLREDAELFHTCFALHGSSGGAVFAPGGPLLAPVGLITEPVRPCDEPDGSEWDNVKSDALNEGWFKEYTDPKNGSLSRSSCVTRAVQVKHVLCERCYRNPIKNLCRDIIDDFDGLSLKDLCAKE